VELFHRAHDQFAALGDRAGQARVQANLSLVLANSEQHEQALTWAERAFRLYRDLADLEGQAGSLINLGLCQVRLGSFGAARDRLSQARDMLIAMGARTWEAAATANLGLAYRGLCDYRRAVACHRAAADLLADLGDLAQQAEVLGDLADTCDTAGQHDQAVAAAQRALGILTELGHPAAEAAQAKLARLRAAQSTGSRDRQSMAAES
jgi:tetratricopeptide (TPR) repeat protein